MRPRDASEKGWLIDMNVLINYQYVKTLLSRCYFYTLFVHESALPLVFLKDVADRPTYNDYGQPPADNILLWYMIQINILPTNVHCILTNNSLSFILGLSKRMLSNLYRFFLSVPYICPCQVDLWGREVLINPGGGGRTFRGLLIPYQGCSCRHKKWFISEMK